MLFPFFLNVSFSHLCPSLLFRDLPGLTMFIYVTMCMGYIFNTSDNKGTFVSNYKAIDVAYSQAKYQPKPETHSKEFYES